MTASNFGETALIASAAACIASFVVVKLAKIDDRRSNIVSQLPPPPPPPPPDNFYYPYPPPTFLQNARTRNVDVPLEETSSQHKRGYSMVETYQKAKEESDKAHAMTPPEVLQSLQKGNSRFFSGTATRPEVSAFHRRTLISQQFPSIAILGCSDSRVPCEIVFDCGLGDMFVVRVAGNCLGTTTQASLDYAVHHLDVKVLLVMGHEGCGAIKAARLPADKIKGETESLQTVLNNIKEGGMDTLPKIEDPRASDREAVCMNVRHQIKKLTEDAWLVAKVNEGSLIIVGAFYEISSGIVDFFMQVSKKNNKTDIKPSPGVESRYHPDTGEIVYA